MVFAESFALLGHGLMSQLDGFGRFTRFAGATLHRTLFGRSGTGRLKLLMPQFFEIGTRSIPVVLLVGGFVGAVLGVEMFEQFRAVGQEARIGGIINLSVVKQIGPVLAAVMIAGRVGGAVSAQIGTMRVTEQVDALRVMGTDPINYLVVPRVIACIIMVPLLTVVSDLMGMVGGWLVVVVGLGVDSNEYWRFSAALVTSFDVFIGLIKATAFGLLIGLISCYKGFNCEPGASGVGKAATDAFVTSFIAIIIANFFLAKFLNDLFIMIFGNTPNALSL
ncbi:MAG: MlaE family ABC transporter permease [Phycisphaerales bacterium JB063]